MHTLAVFSLLLCVLYVFTQESMPTGPYNVYCDPQLCTRGRRHVACERFPSEYQKPCSPEAQLVNLTDYTDVIVKMHNEPRQRLALGRNMTLPRAARLVMMQWSEELATLASYNARMCQAKYDDCRNTANFKNSGQNIILFNMTRLVENELMQQMYPQLLQLAGRTWWSEPTVNASNLMTQTDVQHYPCSPRNPRQPQHFRHFSVMAVENNTHVGCAASRYAVKEITYFKLTCNYAENFVCGKPIYHMRAVGCHTGQHPQYRGLCSKREVFP